LEQESQPETFTTPDGKAFLPYKSRDSIIQQQVKTETPNQLNKNKEKFDPNRKLNSYWLPSLAPNAGPEILEKPSTKTLCLESNHPLRLKQLITVQFTPIKTKDTKSKEGKYQCPSCMRTLTNGPRIGLLPECGHVICMACIDKFVIKSGQCYVCSTPLRNKGVIQLYSQGTGYAGHDEGGKLAPKVNTPAPWI